MQLKLRLSEWIASLTLMFVVCTVSNVAAAYKNELHIDVQVSGDIGPVLNPRAGGLIPVGESASVALRPRLQLGLRYSLTHSFYVGAAAEGMYALSPSLSPFWTVSTTRYDNQPGRSVSDAWSLNFGDTDPALSNQFTGQLYALHGGGSLLFSAGFRPHLGYSYMGIVEAAVGPAIGVWYNTGLATIPLRPDVPAQTILGADQLLHQIVPGAAFRLQAGFEARPIDELELAVLPYLGGSFVGTMSVEAGVAVRGSFVLVPWGL